MVYSKKYISAAYRSSTNTILRIIDDFFAGEGNFNIIVSMCMQVKPKIIITITGQPTNLYKCIDNLVSLSRETQFDRHVDKLIMLPRSEFSYSNCLNRIRCLRLDNEPKIWSAAERITYLNSLINFASYCVTYALGLLLLYIDKNWNSISQRGRIRYSSINYFTM